MTTDEKLEVCRRCAGALIRGRRDMLTEFDELVNIGFANITSNEPKLVFCQAYLHMYNFITKRLATKPDMRELSTSHAAPAIDIAADREMTKLLKDAVKLLSTSEQTLIYDKFFRGLTLREIGLEYRITKQSVKWRLNKILKKLKDVLNK